MFDIKNLKEYYTDVWWQASPSINLNLNRISNDEKRKNETIIERIIEGLVKNLNEYPENEEEKVEWKERTIKFLEDNIFTQNIIKLDFIENEIKERLIESTREFILYSKQFDENISYEDIGQAMRNLWIINIFQMALGIKITLTKSVFGYSMLYPYTDNYLDNINITIDEKKKFNERFLEKLKGYKINSLNIYEEKVFNLIEFIEDEFDREHFKDVYESLLLIHNGQEESLNQQKNCSTPYEKDILGITLGKGGASVLVDGYLINGFLNNEMKEFCYGYGFILQLIDDLQDVKSDLKNNHMTIASQLAGKYHLDEIASKVISLTSVVIENEKCFIDDKKESLKKLILDSCIYMILFAIVSSKEFYSKEYIDKIEEFLPFSLYFCRNIKKKFLKRIKSISRLKSNTSIDNIILDILE